MVVCGAAKVALPQGRFGHTAIQILPMTLLSTVRLDAQYLLGATKVASSVRLGCYAASSPSVDRLGTNQTYPRRIGPRPTLRWFHPNLGFEPE